MNPTIVHRYAFPVREAIEALLGDAAGDCEAWRIRVEGEEIVVDVAAPALQESPQNMRETMPVPSVEPSLDQVASLATNETAKIVEHPESELKGGPLARQAAIACGERGFWTFLEVSGADEAKAAVCRRCGVDSRKKLDHDEDAAAIWKEIDRKYRLWLEGYD